MKKLLLTATMTVLLGVLSHFSGAQNMNKHIDNAQNKGIDYLSSNDYILSGDTYPPAIAGMPNVGPWAGNLSRIQLQKIDNMLNTVWFKTYVTQAEKADYDNGICNHLTAYFTCGYAKETQDRGFIICGRVRKDPETSGCPGANYDNIFLLKVDAAGNVQWYKRYDRTGMLFSVIEAANGNFIACGYEGNYVFPTSLIIGTDAGGNILWSRNTLTQSYWDHNIIVPSVYKQVIEYQGNYALVGYGSTNGVFGTTIVSVIDASGNFFTNTMVDDFADGNTVIGLGIADAHDGELAVTGFAGKPCQVGAEVMVFKINPWTPSISYLKIYSYGNYGDVSRGEGITVVNNSISVTGVDNTRNGALYIQANMTGNLARYVPHSSGLAWMGHSITSNTAGNYPVYSGEFQGGSGYTTFVIKNDLNYDCDHGIWVPEIDLQPDMYDPHVIDPGVKQIDDGAIAFDLKPKEYIACGGVVVPPTPAAKNGSTSVNDISAEAGLTISPNPAYDYLELNIDKAFAGAQVKIYDITGRLVLRNELAGATKYRLDISGIAPGMYNLKVEGSGGLVKQANFVKNQ